MTLRVPSRSTWATAVLVLLVVALVASCAVVASHAIEGTTSSAGPSRGARLVFSDQFNEPALDTTKWITCYPWASPSGCTNNGNHELEWFLPGGVSVSGGALHLTAQRQFVVGDGRRFSFSSGMVASAHAFQFTYGYVEFQARMPKGAGMWPALWLLPANESFPPEIDVVEVNSNAPNTAVFTYHPQRGRLAQDRLKAKDLSAGWHTYAIDWRPGSITWFLDGKRRFQFTGHVSDQPMYLLMDLAVSSKPPPDASTPPSASFDVRSVRVWQPG